MWFPFNRISNRMYVIIGSLALNFYFQLIGFGYYQILHSIPIFLLHVWVLSRLSRQVPLPYPRPRRPIEFGWPWRRRTIFCPSRTTSGKCCNTSCTWSGRSKFWAALGGRSTFRYWWSRRWRAPQTKGESIGTSAQCYTSLSKNTTQSTFWRKKIQ